jgi:murein DD-endopeptidase MepM/ murein hydrolase activator NlpD
MMAKYFVTNALEPNGNPRSNTYWPENGGLSFQAFTRAGANYSQTHDSNAEPVGDYQKNLNLLAIIVGDDPADRINTGERLVPPFPCRVFHRQILGGRQVNLSANNFSLQPSAIDRSTTAGSVQPLGMPIGSGLAQFLDDPLETGQSLNLTLPFVDPGLFLADPGGWLRGNFNNTFHCALDFESVPAISGQPQRLFDVAAAADGVVRFLRVLNNGQANEGGIVLQHEVAPGVVFHTLYFHMDKTTIPFSVGDRVKRGQVLGKIVRWMDGAIDMSHLHFMVAVQAPTSTLNCQHVPRLWFLIDPCGVYDYRTDNNYYPRTTTGWETALRGAERKIHWAADPMFWSLPVEHLTEYAPIRRVQVRVRRKELSGPDQLGEEHDQFLVWLDGMPETEYFFAPIKQASDRTGEVEMIATLREAFLHGKQVKLGYQRLGGLKTISAVWVGA